MCGCKANLMLCYATCFVYCDKKCILGAVERWRSNLLELMSLILKICLWAFIYFMSLQNMFIDDDVVYFTTHYTVMGHISLMGAVLFSASCEIIFLTLNYKIRFSFVESMNTSLFRSNNKGEEKEKQQKEICSKISYHVTTSFSFPKVWRGVRNSVLLSVISASDNPH